MGKQAPKKRKKRKKSVGMMRNHMGLGKLLIATRAFGAMIHVKNCLKRGKLFSLQYSPNPSKAHIIFIQNDEMGMGLGPSQRKLFQKK